MFETNPSSRSLRNDNIIMRQFSLRRHVRSGAIITGVTIHYVTIQLILYYYTYLRSPTAPKTRWRRTKARLYSKRTSEAIRRDYVSPDHRNNILYYNIILLLLPSYNKAQIVCRRENHFAVTVAVAATSRYSEIETADTAAAVVRPSSHP